MTEQPVEKGRKFTKEEIKEKVETIHAARVNMGMKPLNRAGKRQWAKQMKKGYFLK